MPEKYVCTLSEKSLKKAKKELNEDPKERLGAVETFRTWIESQKHIKCCTDTTFLLAFLRVSKFSQLKARERIETYLKIFQKYPEWTVNIDTQDPAIKAFFKSGYVVLCGRDDDGKYVSMADTSKVDLTATQYTKNDVIKGMVASTMMFMLDEEMQVNGHIYFEDTSNFSMKHQSYFGIEDSKKTMQLWQNALPQRFKGLHFYNVGPVLEGLFKLIKPVLSKKWVERMKFHSTMESVYKIIPMKCLPLEYLPDDYKGPNVGSMESLMDDMYRKISTSEMRQKILFMTNPENFHIDLDTKDNTEAQASFRKLNVD